MSGYEYEVQGFYGQGWEMVTTEATKAEAEDQRRCYVVNEPGTTFRVKRIKQETASVSDTKTYRIVRFYRDDKPSETIVRGLTLEQAQDHCNRDDTHGDGWFDGYQEESTSA